MHTTFSPHDEHESRHIAMQEARTLIADRVREAAQEGHLQAIALDQKAFICTLVLGPLAPIVTEGSVTLPMLERWAMEAISHQAQAHKKSVLTAQSVYLLSVKAGDPGENYWIWPTLPEEVQDFYKRLADLLNEALDLCDSCGERKPDDLHEVAGMRLCSLCISPPQSKEDV